MLIYIKTLDKRNSQVVIQAYTCRNNFIIWHQHIIVTCSPWFLLGCWRFRTIDYFVRTGSWRFQSWSHESNKKMLDFFRSIVKQETALLFRVLFFQVIHLYTLNNECISYVKKKSISHVQWKVYYTFKIYHLLI